MRLVIREYTREAGVRNLERRIADLCRKAATQIAKGEAEKIRVDDALVREWLGPRRFSGEVRKRTSDPGVATGSRVHGGRRRRPLHRGDGLSRQGPADDHRPARRGDAGVRAGGALVGARALRKSSACPTTGSQTHDVHIHVPAGAVPKDGPSAGITMATAIASLVRGEPVSAATSA